jgi:starch synthase
MKRPLRILFLVPEMVPFAKTGGLADVAGALPAALARLGTDVRVVLPRYRCIRERGFATSSLVSRMIVPLGAEALEAGVLETASPDGVPVWLVEREEFFDRPALYNSAFGDYYDNFERYSFFCHAALRCCEEVGFVPDVVHAHDWQCGLAPALLQGSYRNTLTFAATRSVFTIHNIAYQGIFPAEKMPLTGLDPASFYHPEGLEYWGRVSLLKAGLGYADALTTVSPTYARELLTPEFGMGMDGLLTRRRDVLSGIMNGADYGTWNPGTDPDLPARYDLSDRSGKKRCKKALLSATGMDSVLVGRPLFGMVSRLVEPKGVGLVAEVVADIVRMGGGLVVLGTGEPELQDRLRAIANEHKGRVSIHIGYDDVLAHRIYAGADLWLVPSRFEPCGLTQLYAMRYGAVPVVREVGGLADSVQPFDPAIGTGTGFRFRDYDAASLRAAVQQAIDLYHRRALWDCIVTNAMRADFSWSRSAVEYLDLYERLVENAG